MRATPDLAHFFLIIFLILITVALAATAALGELINFFATLSGGLWLSLLHVVRAPPRRHLSSWGRFMTCSEQAQAVVSVCMSALPLHLTLKLHCAASVKDGLKTPASCPWDRFKACCWLLTLAACLLHPQ